MRYNSTILRYFVEPLKLFLLKIKKNGKAFHKYCRTIVRSLASRNSNDPSLHASKGALMWHNQSSFFLYLTRLFYYILSYYLKYIIYILFQYYRPLIIQGRLEVIDINPIKAAFIWSM